MSKASIGEDHADNAVTWWGDERATIETARVNVRCIIAEFTAGPDALLLCGVSRRVVGVTYRGLHDDEIARLWTALIAHDYFDSLKQWRGAAWEPPLEEYREAADERLQRVGHRPYLVSQNGGNYGSEVFSKSLLTDADTYPSFSIDAGKIPGGFPNEFTQARHRVLGFEPSSYRTVRWEWMNRATTQGRRRRSESRDQR